MKKTIDIIKASLKKPPQNKLLFTYSMLSDFFFFASFLIVYVALTAKILDYLYQAMNLLPTNTLSITDILQSNPQSIADIIKPELVYYLGMAFEYLSIMLVAIFVIWFIFEGISIYFCAKIAEAKDISFFRLIGKHFILSIVWTGLLYSFAYTYVKLSVMAKMSLIKIFSQTFILLMFIVSLLILFYFAIISYSLIPKTKLKSLAQKTIIIGIKKYRQMLKMYLAIIIPSIVLGGILALCIIFNIIILFYAIFILVFIPLLSVAKIFAISFIEKENF